MTDEHTSDAFSIKEGDEVTLVTNDEEVNGICTERSKYHHPDPEVIHESRIWIIEGDDGEEYRFGVQEGISRTKGGSPYPVHTPLMRKSDKPRQEAPEEDLLGHIKEVQHD